MQIGGFRVLRRLASGGTADIFLARAAGPHGFERVVVLKVLLQRFRNDPAFERMFAREASAYARLSHPAIVKLFDFFSTDGQLVMVLEYVDGLPLNKLRAMLSITGDKLDDRASFFVAARVFSALAAAHAAKDPETGEFAPVIHRDINPSNVLVPWDGHVKLADFGIAKVAGMQGDTKTGFIKGTYGYMAPEQVRGEAVTGRADVYAATLLLWELLTRRKAIQRGALPEVEVLKAMAKPQFPSLDALRPEIDASVRDAVRRGLEPLADRRAISAEEMTGILRAAVHGADDGRSLLLESLARVRPPPSADQDITLSRTRPGGPPSTPPASADQPPPTTPSTGQPVGQGAEPHATAKADPGPPRTLRFGDGSEPPRPAGQGEPTRTPPAPRASAPAPRPSSPGAAPRPTPTPTPPPATSPRTLAFPTFPGPTGARPAARVSSPSDKYPSDSFPVPESGWGDPAADVPPPEPKPSSGRVRPPPLPPSDGAGGDAAHPLPPPGLAYPTAGPPVATPPPPSSAFQPQPPASAMPSLNTTTPYGATLISPSPAPGLSGPVPQPQPLPPAHAPPPYTPPPSARPQAPGTQPGAPKLPAQMEAGLAVVPPPPRRSSGGMFVLLILALIGGTVLGYFGFFWRPRHGAILGTSTSAGPSAIPLAVPPPQAASAMARAGRAPSASPSAAVSVTPAPSVTPAASASSSSTAKAVTSAVPAASAIGAASATVTPAASAVPAPSAAPTKPPTSASADDGGDLVVSISPGHRVYVDGHVAGQSPGTFHVKCGTRSVHVGSSQAPKNVDVPCGGSVEL